MGVDLMVDIETLATDPRAIVLSIGAVRFTRDGPLPEQFYACLGLGDQVAKARRTLSVDTLMWWMDQSAEARAKAFSRQREGVTAALRRLADFVPDGANVWANGPSFDLVILESLYFDARLEQPWPFWRHRCVRTIVEAGGVDARRYASASHHPVEDCLRQVAMVNAARRNLNVG
jgi:hypothetical protein